VDVHTRAQRSANMAAIRGEDTKPELRLRRALHARGYRFLIHVRSLAGKPDIVFTKRRAVVFVNGCFWHSHDCRYGRVTPATNTSFWMDKRGATVLRDARQHEQLIAQGWRVRAVWECELKDLKATTSELEKFLGPPRIRNQPADGLRKSR
jgi:DNA mismatch endonuclease (patch repair protein)